MKLIGSRTIETERLILRSSKMKEQKRLWEILMMPEINRFYLTSGKKYAKDVKHWTWEEQEKFIEILKKYDFSYTKGFTWTTDAFYRETKEKIDYFKANGAICVEMEGSAIAAVCKRKKLDYFTFYYAGDNLDAAEWEERSIRGLSNIDKKKQVMTLALELAQNISE